MSPVVLIGTDKNRIDEERYFYYEINTDATPIIQAALEYANKEHEIIIIPAIIRRRITGKYGLLRKPRTPEERLHICRGLEQCRERKFGDSPCLGT